jgi:hypothetical protein
MTEPTFNPNSILDGTKKALGVGFDYDVFDHDIIMHINTVLSTLTQLGIGPETGLMIEGPETEWVTFLGDDPNLNSAKSYVYLRVRMLFDPPPNSFTQTAMEKQIAELEWRLNSYRESNLWRQAIQIPAETSVTYITLDGGTA